MAKSGSGLDALCCEGLITGSLLALLGVGKYVSTDMQYQLCRSSLLSSLPPSESAMHNKASQTLARQKRPS